MDGKSVIGYGSYSNIVLTPIASKEYSDDLAMITRDAIREASVLGYLNDRKVDCVPTLYHASSRLLLEDEEHISHTNLQMELVGGKTLFQLIIMEQSSQGRCSVILKYLDKIIAAVQQLHLHGVTHNDLNPSNIMIADEDRVVLIDFGISTFGDNYDLDEKMDMYNSPEFLTNHRTGYATDWWILGSSLLNQCLEQDYIPLIPLSQEEDIFRYIKGLDRDRVKEFQEAIKIISDDNGIIIPDIIPSQLAEKLRPMITFIPSKRGYRVEHPQIIRSDFSLIGEKVDRDKIDYVLTEIAEFFSKHLRSHKSHLGVAIDIYQRFFRATGRYSHQVDGIELMSLAISIIICDAVDLHKSIRSKLKLIHDNIVEISKLQNEILNTLRWRIFTKENLSLTQTDNYGIMGLYYKISTDNNRSQLLFSSQEEIHKYFSESDQ